MKKNYNNKIKDILSKELLVPDYYQASNIIKENFKKNKKNIFFLCSYTFEMIEQFIIVESFKKDMNLNIKFSEYNQFEKYIFDNKSLIYKKNNDLIILSIRIDEILPEFNYEFGSYNKAQISKKSILIINYFKKLLSKIRNHTDATILLNNFVYPKFIEKNLSDHQNDNGQINFINNLNKELAILIKSYIGIYIFDINYYIYQYGENNVYDNKLYYYASIPFKANFLKFLSKKYSDYFSSIFLGRKKCLVIDLDNTIWGGIIGEDGINGIKLGDSYPGNVYLDIQKTIKQISQNGILLAINSKNNYFDIEQVFKNHPNMALKMDDFSSIKINWSEKHDNMMEISKELRIDPNSFVFIDDSLIEIEKINITLPNIETIHFSTSAIEENLNKISNCSYFNSINITDEDRKKTIQYKDQKTRLLLKNNINSLKKYYFNLNLNIKIMKSNDYLIPRISQLTLKTNQFNLTTKRYTESDILKYTKKKNYYVYCLEVKDKIGDYGITGVVIGYKDKSRLIIDTFLLSCRIIGRGIENAFLSQFLKAALDKDVKKIIGEYFPTKKNDLVKNFYKDCGFKKNKRYWELNSKKLIKFPQWIKINIDNKI